MVPQGLEALREILGEAVGTKTTPNPGSWEPIATPVLPEPANQMAVLFTAETYPSFASQTVCWPQVGSSTTCDTTSKDGIRMSSTIQFWSEKRFLQKLMSGKDESTPVTSQSFSMK
jgi:hypothetical protein